MWGNEDDGYRFTAPVRKYPSGVSWVGAYDLAGNVWEWVQSTYQNYPYQANSEREKVDIVNSADVEKVLRGGAWSQEDNGTRASIRGKQEADIRNHNYGFRCLIPLNN